jgi:F0F1-type ATP synthase alpha subunit
MSRAQQDLRPAVGIALNLEENEVGCVILGDVSQLKEGGIDWLAEFRLQPVEQGGVPQTGCT